MARRRTPVLTDGELRLMTVIWERGEATVGDVVEALPAEQPLAYNTVLTTMRILERKGYVDHFKRGRAFVFRPLVSRDNARSKALRHMLRNLFDDSPEQLVLNILKDEELGDKEIERLRQIIDENTKG